MKKEYKLKEMRGYKRTGNAKADPDATVSKTFRMPLDVLAWLLQEGEKRHVGYQTAMVQILRTAMERKLSTLVEELAQAQAELEDAVRRQLEAIFDRPEVKAQVISIVRAELKLLKTG